MHKIIAVKQNQKLLKYNSVVAFVLAGILATTVHELFHFLTALLLDGTARITPVFAQTGDSISKNNSILVAAAGPILSLLTGLLVIAFCRKGTGFNRLLWMWFGFLSAQIGAGYFLISSFAKDGDTGQALTLLNAHWMIYAITTIIGAVGTYFILPRLFSAQGSVYVKDKIEFFQLGMHPWWIGTTILVVLYYLIEVVAMGSSDFTFISILGTATIGIFTPLADYKPTKEKAKLILSNPTTPIVATVLLAALLLFGLSHGVAIGSGG